MVRPSVDLPPPDSPTSPRVSPFLIWRSTPSTAWTCATVRCTTPDVTGNHFLRSRTDSSGWSGVHTAFRPWRGATSTILELLAALRHPAGGHLGLADPLQRWPVLGAPLDSKRAARVEGATARN